MCPSVSGIRNLGTLKAHPEELRQHSAVITCDYHRCGGFWQMRRDFFNSPFGLKFLLRHNIYVWIGYGRIIEYTSTIYIGQIKVKITARSFNSNHSCGAGN